MNTPLKTKQLADNVHSSEDYLAAIKRRAKLFILVSLSVVAAASLIAFVLPNEYRSFARISINLHGAYIKSLEPIQVAAYADQYIAELSDRVQSRDNMQLFYDELTKRPLKQSSVEDIDQLRELRDGFFFTLETQPVMSDSGREVEIIAGFLVGFEAADAELAFRAAKFLSASFLEEDRRSRTERASSTSTFLTEQIAETEELIVTSENEIATFKVRNACCLPELKELNMSTIQRAERDIDSLQPRIRTLEQDRVFLQAQLDEIRRLSGPANRLEILEQDYRRLLANYGPGHPNVIRVQREIDAMANELPRAESGNELDRLRGELTEAELKYSDRHPDVRSLRQRIAALEAREPENINAGEDDLIEDPRFLQLRAAINAVDIELMELRRREPELRQIISDFEQRLAQTPQVEGSYQALNRKLDTARENFNSLQQRLVTARQTEALESAEIGARLNEVQPPYLPDSPSGPPRLGIVILGILIAFGLGTASILLAEMLDSTIRGSIDVAKITEIVPIAIIPEIQNAASKAALRRNMVLAVALLLALAIGVAGILVLGTRQ